MTARPCLLTLLCAAALAACTPRERTTELQAIDPNAGYRLLPIEAAQPKPRDDTFVVATFSGGGTRAAALAAGALQGLALATVPKPDGGAANFGDQINVISSVSGGSVTAAYYGLRGRQGLPEFTSGFLKRNVQGHLIGEALLPWTWARLATPSYARIDALRDYFDANLFDHATYQSLLAAGRQEPRPMIVLNASDMANGSPFSFTQDQFDLICADLAQLHLADAVAASAAFPVALTALTLKNRAPCAAQAKAPADFRSGWVTDATGKPLPDRTAQALGQQAINPERYRRGLLERGYLNRDGSADYIQLLDGGVSDNLGLGYPIRLLTSHNDQESLLAMQNLDRVKHIVLVVVNARSEPDNSYGRSATPPGVISTLLTTIGSPIDGTSYALLGQLDAIVAHEMEAEATVIRVDFDFIADDACRRSFKNLATSWSLKPGQVDALQMLGSAMVAEAQPFRDLITGDLKGTIQRGPSVDDACRTLAAVGS
jgi:NTE family protein